MSSFSIGSGRVFDYDEGSPLVGSAGHRYYFAAQRGVRRSSGEPTEDYLLVVSNNLAANPTPYAHWRSHMTVLAESGRLPKSIARPVAHFLLNGREAYVVRLPGRIRDYKLAVPQNRWGNFPLLFELCCRGIMDASMANLEAAAILINESDSCLFVDTMPNPRAAPLNFYGLLGDFRNDYDVNRIKSMVSGRKYEDCVAELRQWATRLSQCPEEGAPPPAKIELMISATVSGKTSRKIVAFAPGAAGITLGALIPGAGKLSNRPVMRISRTSTGTIALYNCSRYTWLCSRYSGLPIRPNAIISPRLNESFTIDLDFRRSVQIKVRRFIAAQPTAPQATAPRAAAQRARATAPRAAASPAPKPAPATKALPAPASAPKPGAPAATPTAKGGAGPEKPAPEPLSGLYDRDASNLPKPGRNVSAVELATGRRVTLECCRCADPSLREELLARRNNPLPPIAGLCGMTGIHMNPESGDFLLASEAPSGEGWLRAGSPELRALPLERLYAPAEAMMRLLADAASRGLVPARFLETRLLVRPQTGEACFLDGAWLVRERRVNLACTLGYRAPEAYAPEHRAALTDLSFCAAVWLYRLLVGGYPLEGARTRQALREAARTGNGAPSGEAELAERLYGRDAVFAFDPADRSNSIEALDGACAEQLRRWKRLPEALRRAWIQSLSTCLHENAAARVSPARWAELLRDARKGES